jgi:hypothetical protein
MLAEWGVLIKVVVDVEREVMTGGGEMHADGESILLADGSRHEDLWGANWYSESGEIRYEALINIRPRHGNTHIEIKSQEIRNKMETIVRRLLEDAP